MPPGRWGECGVRGAGALLPTPGQGCGLGHSGSGLSQFMDQQGPLWLRGDLVEWSEEPQPPAAGAGTLSPRAGRGSTPHHALHREDGDMGAETRWGSSRKAS